MAEKALAGFVSAEFAMPFDCPSAEDDRSGFEIGARFRAMIAERIERLEEDATRDEAMIPLLDNADHRGRQRRLVDAQRAEAARMRRFLDHSRTRFPNPLITL
jgi:hypothetical protein